jgi:hypothetical protein
MVLAYAGRRAASLPDVSRLEAGLRRLLAALHPSAVVGSAADGADLLMLEAALGLDPGPAIHVVLPTARSLFVTASVQPAWRKRFAHALDEVTAAGGTIESLELRDSEDAYRAANRRILDVAGAERSVGLTIASHGEGMMVDAFADEARRRGVPVLRLDPRTA